MLPAEISHGRSFQSFPVEIRYWKGFEKNLQQFFAAGKIFCYPQSFHSFHCGAKCNELITPFFNGFL
jgi:hypothetical protein